MPHSTRKHRPSPSSKRRFLPSSNGDGWTHVLTTHHKPSTHGSSTARKPLQPADIPPGLTLEKLHAEYARHLQIFQASECWTQLRAMLAEAVLPSPSSSSDEKKKRTDDCVCVGLGSPSDPISRRITLFQLAALESILSLLDTSPSHQPLKTYAQDPVFNALDTAFLTSLPRPLDMTIVADPAAVALIKPSTLVYAPHCERSFLLPALHGRNPAMLLGNDMDALLTGPLSSSLAPPETETARTFLRHRTSRRFPVFEPLEAAFNDTRVYWTEDGDEDENDASISTSTPTSTSTDADADAETKIQTRAEHATSTSS
ncbi:MAG: hypothetical protein M1819_004573 [Sarea resinae]|nr:MAG: hypothetical protein M1819_004573 [Sarea resinae]